MRHTVISTPLGPERRAAGRLRFGVLRGAILDARAVTKLCCFFVQIPTSPKIQWWPSAASAAAADRRRPPPPRGAPRRARGARRRGAESVRAHGRVGGVASASERASEGAMKGALLVAPVVSSVEEQTASVTAPTPSCREKKGKARCPGARHTRAR